MGKQKEDNKATKIKKAFIDEMVKAGKQGGGKLIAVQNKKR